MSNRRIESLWFNVEENTTQYQESSGCGLLNEDEESGEDVPDLEMVSDSDTEQGFSDDSGFSEW